MQQLAAETAAGWAREQGAKKIWYVGHWGFQYYAERVCGMQAVIPAYYRSPNGTIPLPEPSRLERGDWLVLPDSRLIQQSFEPDDDKLEPMGWLAVGDPLPLWTVPCFYGGRTAIEHREGPYLEVRLYRVKEGFTARPAPAPTERLPE
jgi:hypothetical protein